MLTYVLRRVALVPVIIVGVMTIVFALTSALPVEDKILAQHQPPIHAKCSTTEYCPCSEVGGNATNTSICKNPFFWRIYDELGLNEPVPVQWGIFMYHSLTFQWGDVGNNSLLVGAAPYSYAKGIPVASFLAGILPYTVELALVSLAIILAISIPLGNLSAVNRNRPVDQASRVMSFSGFAIPAYLLGGLVLIGIVLLSSSFIGGIGTVSTPWCHAGESIYDEFTGSWPVEGCYTGAVQGSTGFPVWIQNSVVTHPTGFPTLDAAYHGQYWLAMDTLVRLILPALVIAYGSIAGLLRFVRNSMLEVMNLDYIRTARAKGVPEKVVVNRHAGRNSLNVTITVLGLTFAFFIGGFPVIEDVFQLDGVGRALALSVQPNIDFGVIFGSTLLFTYLVVAANIIVDVLYAYLDPRVRLG
jgi:ABC-type dipeptide/oligopeptide/nickel transport system permease component